MTAMERWTRGCVALGLALSTGSVVASPVVPLAWRLASTPAQQVTGPQASGYRPGPSAQGPSMSGGGISRLPSRMSSPAGPAAPAGPDAMAACRKSLAEARFAIDQGNYAAAERSLRVAESCNVPDAAFAPGEKRPWEVRLVLDQVAGKSGPANRTAGPQVRTVAFDDPSAPAGGSFGGPVVGEPSIGVGHFEAGMRAVTMGDRDAALLSFEKAWDYRDSLDPKMRQSLQDQMSQIRGMAAQAATRAPASPRDPEAERKASLRNLVFRQVTDESAQAEKMQLTNPRGALEKLVALRNSVASNQDIDDLTRQKMVLKVDRDIADTEQYIRDNLPQIENEEGNQAVKDEIAQREAKLIAVETKLADLINQFNSLIDQQRYAEAEVVAKQAHALAPGYPEVEALLWKSQFVRRIAEIKRINDAKENGFQAALASVEESSIPFDDRNPLLFGDARKWNDMTQRRLQSLDQGQLRRTPAELEIQNALAMPVDVKFVNTPLADVIQRLGEMTGINVHIDERGLANEGVLIDQPINLNLPKPISLHSALNTILHPLGLDAEIQNEALLITSHQMTNRQLKREVYEVGDLVMPIPNFIPSTNVGLAGALKEAYSLAQFNRGVQQYGPSGQLLADNSSLNGSRSALAQMSSQGMLKNTNASGFRQVDAAPDALGGAAMADFTSLIELVTSTIAPESWDEVGGVGSIKPFPTNLTLVVSQTQENHEAIADLLKQLRRLQDLQVTIEVRYITLRDDFFERIGVDFDFNIDDNVISQGLLPGDDSGNSATVGLIPAGGGGFDGTYNPNVNSPLDGDLQFRQNSFGSALPQFGGFDVGTAANFGFAILSDVEVYLLLQAVQGDQRSNILQAPKVTLFNGQTANINDTLQTPFVTSVIPVVGDFAAAQQPVVCVLSEGTQLNVQAVVSHDRRFVRLTLVPFFSRIGNVTTFTFQQKQTYQSGTGVFSPTNVLLGRNDVVASTEGTTVQLPEFAQTSVTTTVSVPDGGTILLGGIKRLSEGRVERGVPMLDKIPYVNRLFKNVGIGRETSSLMFMVTPRIIIQEEEELDQTQYQANP